METGEIAGKLLPLLFNLMGPIGLMPAFANMTAHMDRPTSNAVALRAALFSAIGIVLAVFISEAILKGWGIDNPALILAAGAILTLSALRTMLASPPAGAAPAAPPDPMGLAVKPLAFPTIVSPQAVGVIIIFVAFLPSIASKLTVMAVAAFILLLNLGAMGVAPWFMARIGMAPLLVLGAVFGVLQVALGVEMILDGVSLATLDHFR